MGPATSILAMFSVGLTLVACANARAADPARAFSFRDAEFMRDDEARKAAEAFVASRLPEGLPLPEALARLRRAEMRCGAPTPASGVIACDYIMPVHIGGGIIGEDVWQMQLTPAPNGTLASATVRHDIVGAGPPGVQ